MIRQFIGQVINLSLKCLGSNRRHSKCVHFTDFSHNGKFLFTGSVDGTAKIWNIDFDSKQKKEDISKRVLELNDQRLVATLEEKRTCF